MSDPALPKPVADLGDAVALAIVDAISLEPAEGQPALLAALRDGRCTVTREGRNVIVRVLDREVHVALVPVPAKPRLDA